MIKGELMKDQQAFRPLQDFERQIDDAFIRYHSKIKKRRKEFKLNNEMRKSLNIKTTAKVADGRN